MFLFKLQNVVSDYDFALQIVGADFSQRPIQYGLSLITPYCFVDQRLSPMFVWAS